MFCLLEFWGRSFRENVSLRYTHTVTWPPIWKRNGSKSHWRTSICEYGSWIGRKRSPNIILKKYCGLNQVFPFHSPTSVYNSLKKINKSSCNFLLPICTALQGSINGRRGTGGGHIRDGPSGLTFMWLHTSLWCLSLAAALSAWKTS